MAAPAMSNGASVNVSDVVLDVYYQMLPNTPGGVDFLFGQSFSEALQITAERVAVVYKITKEEVIEELRRFLAIKAFTCDKYAVKISPTPLSTHGPSTVLSLP